MSKFFVGKFFVYICKKVGVYCYVFVDYVWYGW